jgi:hypothetical protein
MNIHRGKGEIPLVCLWLVSKPSEKALMARCAALALGR